ncbi:MAG: hypothetical protein J7J25_05825 [Candidatus Omnitrophica bacterium]|nr:hypothetical protein [Candidatus Omnitrophota bacterium]
MNDSLSKEHECKRCIAFSKCRSYNSSDISFDIKELPQSFLRYIFFLFFLPAVIFILGLLILHTQQPLVSFFVVLLFLSLYYFILRLLWKKKSYV